MKTKEYTFDLHPALMNAITEMATAQFIDVNRFVELLLLKAVNKHHCDVITLHQERKLSKDTKSLIDSKK